MCIHRYTQTWEENCPNTFQDDFGHNVQRCAGGKEFAKQQSEISCLISSYLSLFRGDEISKLTLTSGQWVM